MSIKIVGGMYKVTRGVRSNKLTTDKVHSVNDDKTFCNIDYRASEILGTSQDGEVSQVNCKRCLNAMAKQR